MLLVPCLAWLVHDGGAMARRFALISFLSALPTNIAKELLGLPRPPRSFHVRVNEHVAQQFGFPSTHSAHAISQAWQMASDSIALGAGHISASLLAVSHTVHVCISRLYMGMHSLADVVGGLAFGILAILVFETLGRHADAFIVQNWIGQLGVVIFILISLGCYPDRRHNNTAYTELVDLAGLYLGACIATGPARRVGVAVPSDGQLTTRSLLGFSVVGLALVGVALETTSATAKAIVRRLSPHLQARAELARHLIINAGAGVLIFMVSPSSLENVLLAQGN